MNICRYRISLLLVMVSFAVVVQGCAVLSPPTTAEQYDNQTDQLIQQTLTQAGNHLVAGQSVTVVSASLLQGNQSNRLEEMIVEKISQQLRLHYALYIPTRQNWFELREGRPLTFAGQSAAQREVLGQLVVFEVNVSRNAALERIIARVIALNAQGQTVRGIMAEQEFSDQSSEPWQSLAMSPALKNPLPQGLEERPYASLDRFAYSLASELTDCYRSGLTTGPHAVADEEVNVVLYAKNSSAATRTIQNALQQAIVSQRGFTCAVSRDDLAPAFQQLEIYRNNPQLFDMGKVTFTPGTVLLMVDTTLSPAGDKTAAALRGMWRVSPLESDGGELIADSYAGTYLSGFTAKAYMAKAALSGGLAERPLNQSYQLQDSSQSHTPQAYKPDNQHGFE